MGGPLFGEKDAGPSIINRTPPLELPDGGYIPGVGSVNPLLEAQGISPESVRTPSTPTTKETLLGAAPDLIDAANKAGAAAKREGQIAKSQSPYELPMTYLGDLAKDNKPVLSTTPGNPLKLDPVVTDPTLKKQLGGATYSAPVRRGR
jgi:hypothetical protein